jgi:DNA-directed RNA polymerase I subunit RPA1
MNVTLGIPRLREILMTASKDISTPIMTCPLRPGKTREDAERLATHLRKLRLVDLIEKIEVGEVPYSVQNGQVSKVYKVILKLYSPDRYPQHLNLQLDECEQVVRTMFIPKLMKEVEKAFKASSGKSKENAIQVLQPSQMGEGDSTAPAAAGISYHTAKQAPDVFLVI